MSRTVNQLTVRTPEGTEFFLYPAGPVLRMLAWLADLVVVLMLLFGLHYALARLARLSPDMGQTLFILGYFTISTGYGMVAEWYGRGQTPGKRLFRLRVVDERGRRIRPSQIILRNLLRSVDALPGLYLTGGLATLCHARRQRIGDWVAGTLVVRIPRLESPAFEQIGAGKFNSFRRHPHIEARLRQAMPTAGALLAVQAILRRDGLEEGARLALFRELADWFKTMAVFPADTVEDLSDEQYVRNTLDTVFRRAGASARRALGA